MFSTYLGFCVPIVISSRDHPPATSPFYSLHELKYPATITCLSCLLSSLDHRKKNNVGTSFMHTPIGCSPDYPRLDLAQPSCKVSHKFNTHFLTSYCSPHPDPNLNFPLLQYHHIKTPHQAPIPYHCLSLCLEKLKLRRNLIAVPF